MNKLSIAIFGFLSLSFPVFAAPSVFQITSDSHQENQPSIFGHHVVYADWGGGTPVDIRMYNLRTGEDAIIVEKEGLQMEPAIWSSMVVYSDFNGNDWDVYVMHIPTGREKAIAALNGSNQKTPQIYGTTIVWEDDRNGNYDIYAYNLATREETQVTSDSYDNYAPRIWDNKVVWYTHTGGGFYEIEGYDIRKDAPISFSVEHPGYQQTPDIFGSLVVWVDTYDSNHIYIENLRSGTRKRLTSDVDVRSYPRIHGRTVTWVEADGESAHNIYSYDIRTETLTQISDDGMQQSSPTIPEIWGNTVVWMSWHTGNGDIYGSVLD